MHKIFLIISREYRVQIREKSFIIMTFLFPLIIIIMTIFISKLYNIENTNNKNIAIIDNSNIFFSKLKNEKNFNFYFFNFSKINQIKNRLKKDIQALIVIPHFNNFNYLNKSINLYSYKPIEIDFLNKLQNIFSKKIRNLKLKKININSSLLKFLETNIEFKVFSLKNNIQIIQKNKIKTFIVGGMMYILMMFIVIYGVRVMRSIVEEKNNRVVEIIISSVRPFQLMIGKIFGTAFVALTQFALWLLLFLIIIITFNLFLIKLSINNKFFLEKSYIFIQYLQNIDLKFLLIMFCIYFIGGYLLFSSFFASVGAIMQNQSDTQQYSIIGSIILIIGFYIGIYSFNNPNSSIVFWFSIIPFTSPITMIGRLYNNVNNWEIIISILILFFSIWGMIFLSSKIYQFGILKYEKK